MDEPTILIVTRRRGGRPRAFEEPGQSVSTWLPASQHDQLIKRANAREMTVSQYVREVIVRDVSKS